MRRNADKWFKIGGIHFSHLCDAYLFNLEWKEGIWERNESWD